MDNGIILYKPPNAPLDFLSAHLTRLFSEFRCVRPTWTTVSRLPQIGQLHHGLLPLHRVSQLEAYSGKKQCPPRGRTTAMAERLAAMPRTLSRESANSVWDQLAPSSTCSAEPPITQRWISSAMGAPGTNRPASAGL